MQVRAGYVLGSIRASLKATTEKWRELLIPLTAFELEGVEEQVTIEHPLLAVADNIISRGMPTLPSLRVEEAIAKATGLTLLREVKGSISYFFVNELTDADKRVMMRALCPIHPALTTRDVMADRAESLGSPAEEDFFGQALPSLVGEWAAQVVEPQRPLDSIVPSENALKFERQRVDFAVELPLMASRKQGLVLEIDGLQYHGESGQRKLDKKRDDACHNAGWQYARIMARDATQPASREAKRIQEYFTGRYAQVLKANYEHPLHLSDQGRRWLTAALAPILVVRIQKALLHLMRSGVLRMERREWRIAVVERDIGGARLAVEDLQELLDQLFALHGQDEQLPAIDLRVYRSSDLPELALGGEEADGWLEDEAMSFNAEVILDASVLMRPGLRPMPPEQVERIGEHAVVVSIRSGYSPRVEPVVAPGRPVTYDVPTPPGSRDITVKDAVEEPRLGPLIYFVRNLFRKTGFRSKQVHILCESLQGKDVIGLLPTGAGKSLTYQLSALLQPGISLVVAPLKSLMQDQYANLQEAGIERTSFINSTLSTSERKKAVRALRQGHQQFVFISPERLQIKEFRKVLTNLDVPITYCIVDEAHCVSEWGHDFRTAYLRLGSNARTFCSTLWKRLPIIALTGTASFDVLADVRRELQFGADTVTVTPDSMERKELKFEVMRVEPPYPEPSEQDYWSIRSAVIEQKMSMLAHLVQHMPSWFTNGGDDGETGGREDFYRPRGNETNSGLLFVPHANGEFGVEAVSSTLRNAMPTLRGCIGTYASSNDQQDDDDLILTQEKYKNNDLSALVATKAFGMGIDKPNIRYVIHLNMSQSLESYYQEAGRAGRDKEEARCVILYCDQRLPSAQGEEAHTLDQDLLLYFHQNAFKGANAEKRFIYNLLKGEAYPENPEEDPDLEAMLARMEPGDPLEAVAIDFASRRVISTITSYLREHVDDLFYERLVDKAGRRASDPEKFIGSLLSGFKKRYDRWPKGYMPDHEEPLTRWFGFIRDEQDTFRAVYRLSTIGLFDDYTVDYNAGVIRALVKKRSDLGYIECVQEYIGRYVSPEQRRGISGEITAHCGKDVIQKCLGYLIDFVYSTIAQKRRNAMAVMEEALRAGVEQGKEAFYRRVNTYFDSRYLPELQRRIKDHDYTLDLVWYFIQATGGADDDVHHLRGACDRLLTEYTDNGALYLMRAFTRCLMAGRKEEAFKADFSRGWELMRSVKGLSHEGYISGLVRFKQEVGEYDSEILDLLDGEIVKAHHTWLSRFNRRFGNGLRESNGEASELSTSST